MTDFILPLPVSVFEIAHKWVTSIQTAITGNQKRRGLTSRPIVKLRCGYNLIQEYGKRQGEINLIKNQIGQNLQNPFLVPIWSDDTTGSILSGTKILTVGDNENRHFLVGKKVIIISKYGFLDYEIHTIASIPDATTIMTVDDATLTWGDAFIYPIYSFDCTSSKADIAQSIKNHGKMTLSFEESFRELTDYDDVVYPTITIPTPVDSKALFNFSLADIKQTYNHPVQTNPAKFGLKPVSSYYADDDYSFMQQGRLYRIGKEQIQEIFNFFDYHHGALKSFYCKVYGNAMIVIPERIIDLSSFEVEIDEELSRQIDANVADKNAMIVYADGTYLFNEIESLQIKYTGRTIITFKNAVTITKALSSISVLELSTFKNDEITIKYNTKDISQTGITVGFTTKK